MGRSPCCDESGLKKGPWTPEEDQKLVKHIQKHGHGSWRALPKLAGLNRCGKSCRLRWTNYLRPDIKRGKFSDEEEQTILNLHSILGNKWSAIANHLPGRTDNEIKNFWNTHLKKKLIQMGFDPMTHRPRTDIFSSLPHLIALASLLENHSSWEEQAVRLQQAEQAVQMAGLQSLQYLQDLLQAPTSSSNNFADLDTINLLNSLSSLKENQVLNSNQLAPIPPSLGATAMPLSHLPELQIPCSFQVPLNNKVDDVSTVNAFDSPWLPSSSTPSPVTATGNPVMNNTSANTFIGDACSASSYGAATAPSSSVWPDLLEDPLFHEIATQF